MKALGVGLATFLASNLAMANWSVFSGTFYEDFGDASHYDEANSDGHWNIVDHAAQGGRFANGVRIRFGDGSDGALSSTTGYTFDTNAHPNGYNFTSVSITGGTITVTGSNPLIIRSQTTINISPAVSVRGGDGGAASSSTPNGASGGTAVAGACAGGAGGASTPTNGAFGLKSDGTQETGEAGGGTSGTGAGAGQPGSASILGPGSVSSFDTAAGFICGSGGQGGGGQNGSGHSGGGAGGGGGGGVIRLIAAGNISTGGIDASGGNGGTSFNDGTACTGNGAGGYGGIVWLQSLGTISTTSTPLFAGGNGGAGSCVAGPAGNAAGGARGDSTSVGTPAWTAGSFTTANYVAGTYTIYSTPYDLGTSDPSFLTPTITSTLNGGTVQVFYAGSSSPTSGYSNYDTDITKLSDQNVRYIKLKLVITTVGTTSPQVNKISVPYTELKVKLAGGCGTTQRPQDPNAWLSWAVFLAMITAAWRKARGPGEKPA